MRGFKGPPQVIYATWDAKYNVLMVHESHADAEREAARDRAYIRVVAYSSES